MTPDTQVASPGVETEQYARTPGLAEQKGTPMETENRASVVLADSLTIPEAVTIGRPDHRGKVHAADVFTREELQAIVQQAHDRYGVVADPFATPGSADVPTEDHSRCATIGSWYGVPLHAFAPLGTSA